MNVILLINIKKLKINIYICSDYFMSSTVAILAQVFSAQIFLTCCIHHASRTRSRT